MMHVGDYLGRRTLYTPDRLAIVDHGKTPALRLTFRELNDRANRLANWLRAEGVARGDRVAILARDGVEHLIAFYACGKLGAIHTPLNWRLHWRENAAILEHVSARGLIFGDDYQAQAGEIVAALRAGPAALSFLLHLDGPGLPGSLWFDTALAQASDAPVTCETLDLEDIACLLFTGGTTGLPKGAMISHRQINWNSLNTVIHDLTHGDVYLNVFPLFHAGGLFTYLATQVTFGNTTHLVRQFDATQVLDLLEREAITVFAAVPTMYQMLTQAPNWEKADLSRLRFCTSGGAPLPVPLIERYVAEKGVKFKQGFGMTEFGPGLFALAPEDAVRKAGSIGRPNFFVDVRVVDDLGEALGPDQPGELVLRGPSGCSGYYNDPEASRAAIDAGGWFHTGDIVRYDDEGYFFVLDRKKDMFISGGENVYPAEIEAALYRHPEVLQCAVVGVPDPQWGEVGVAAVVLRPGAQASPDELLAHLRGQLARYKVPKRVELLDALPLSGMGKILKRELRRTYSPGPSR
ncbi:MAG TPA: long-chain fatty acid--CoA ligase [Anaerolineales bacterium]|nr:long-chain fatty acid--CoA ligase [Anaerolineales bacterium]